MSQQQFEQLLTSLMSPDNNVRGQAEQLFSQAKETQPDQVIQALLQVGRSSTDQNLRPFSLILLRRALVGSLPEKALWERISPQTAEIVKKELLRGIEFEENPIVRNHFCDATYELAADILEDDPGYWSELFEWLLRMASSSTWYHRHSALVIFAHLATYLVDLFSDNFQIIKGILSAGLVDPQNMKVRLAALNAATSFIQEFKKNPARAELQSLLPQMLDVLATCLNQKDEDNSLNALKLLIDLLEMDPGFLKPNAAMIIDAMLKIAQTKELADPIRQLAIEFLATFVENKPRLSRSIVGFIPSMLNILLHMMLEMGDIPLQEWNAIDDSDSALDILNSVVAQEKLDRVCLALNGESIMPDIFTPIIQLINNKQDWKCRHVALMALSMIGEGCYEYIVPHLEQVVKLVLPMFEDEHPRVRWAAANTAGQMSTDFGPKLQKKYHSEIVPRFIKLMDDLQNPKVQAHTAAAIINFCEKFEADLIVPYLDGLLMKLLGLMQSGIKMVQEQALTAVASIAGCAGRHFIKYYDTFVPILKQVLNTATQKEHRMLRGKAMECISLIGIAVGKEKFMEDARQVMDILAQIQNSNMEADDPQREFMLQAWTRISNCLGSDFIPYLKFVMPPLLKSAGLNAGVRIHDPDAPEEEEEPGWEYIDLGEAKISIHTSALDEKATACNTIYCYASEMKEGFFPFVEECSKLLVPLMTFYYHDGVRLASLSTMSMLLKCTQCYLSSSKISEPTLLLDLFGFIYPALIDAVKNEIDPEVLVVGVESIHECMEVMGDNCLPSEGIQQLLDVVRGLITGTQTRRNKLLKGNLDGDEDDSCIIREELNKEDDINNEIAEVVGSLVRHHRTTFMAAFEASTLPPLVLELLQKTSFPSEQQLAICIFDDIVEFLGEQSHPLFPTFIPAMLEYALDPHPGVRQAACYGLGVCAQQGGNLFIPMVPQTLEVLIKTITTPGSRDNDKVAPPTENAISSVGKIIQFQSVISDKIPALMDMWVSWLPIEVDTIEAKVVHQQLCHFIKTLNIHVFGPGGKNLPKVLSIFGRIVDTDLVSPETQSTIKEILAQMSLQIPQDLLQKAFLTLSPESQQKLSSLK